MALAQVFEVGDIVEVVRLAGNDESYGLRIGMTAKIVRIDRLAWEKYPYYLDVAPTRHMGGDQLRLLPKQGSYPNCTYSAPFSAMTLNETYAQMMKQKTATGTWVMSYGDGRSEINNVKQPMKKLGTMLKKLVDGDTQTLLKAGFINGDLERTSEGTKEMLDALFIERKAEIVILAQAKIDEEQAESQ